MVEQFRFTTFDELEKLIEQLVNQSLLEGKDYMIVWDNDNPEDYTGWIEVIK